MVRGLRQLLVAGAAAAAALTGLPAPSALAAPTTQPAQVSAAGTAAVAQDAPVGSNPGLVPVYDAAQRRSRLASPAAAGTLIRNYWTPARMAAAIDADAPPARPGARTPVERPSAAPRTVAQPMLPKDAGFRASVAFTHAVGKVFFRFPSDPPNVGRRCSASTVGSGKRRLVLTAGHCVHGGRGGQWAENWAFVPGYQNGARPVGTFPAHRFWAMPGWFQRSDYHFDYSFVITQNNEFGERVVDRVGGNGLVSNPGRPFVTAMGYPSNFAGGEQQAFCQGGTSRRSIINSDMELGCDMRKGASGGPMLRDYNDANGLGFAVSLMSYQLAGDFSAVYGPYFDGDTIRTYNAAENDSP
jgi:hypothetical protein